MKRILCLILLVITALSNLNAQSVDEMLKRGVHLREQGNLEQSIELL